MFLSIKLKLLIIKINKYLLIRSYLIYVILIFGFWIIIVMELSIWEIINEYRSTFIYRDDIQILKYFSYYFEDIGK